jgi:hypothetical protein
MEFMRGFLAEGVGHLIIIVDERRDSANRKTPVRQAFQADSLREESAWKA